MAISIISIAKNSLKFSLVKALSALIGLSVTIYMAKILAPEEYGVYGLLSLWLMYATLIGPGISSAGSREIPALLGKDKEQEALSIQNISLTSEMLYTIIPFIVLLGASLFYSDPVLKIGLAIVAMSYVATRVANFWSYINFIREKYNTVAKGDLIFTITSPVILLISVHWLNVYALLIGPLLANVVLWIYYLKKGAINYHFKFDRSETIRLAKVGVILQGLGFIFWAFRMADRTIIASTLPLEQLGLYTFAMVFLTHALTLPSDFGGVLQPIMWRETGKSDSIFESFKEAKRFAIYFALGSSVGIPIAQLGFYLIVNLATTKYVDSIPIFSVLSYNIYLVSMAMIPSLILQSSIINRQKISLYFYTIGLALNIIFDFLVIKLGYGVVGVSWVTICTQGLVTFILYHFIRSYLFKDRKEFLIFQARILSPFLVALAFYWFHGYLGLMAPNILVFAAISLAAQVIAWSLIIGGFYRDYLSVDNLRIIVREINIIIRDVKNRLPIKRLGRRRLFDGR